MVVDIIFAKFLHDKFYLLLVMYVTKNNIAHFDKME